MMEIAMKVNDKMILDDYEVSITIDVYDNAGNFMGEYHSEILDDKTVHAIIEQVAKLKGGE